MALRASLTLVYRFTIFVVWNASSFLIIERVVDVLSRSTTPTGMSVGCPLLISEVKNMVTITGNISMQNRYIGFFFNILHSLHATLMMFLMLTLLPTFWFYLFLIISDIPGLSPSSFVTGRAFTSKVFKSYCPLLFVAFHTA